MQKSPVPNKPSGNLLNQRCSGPKKPLRIETAMTPAELQSALQEAARMGASEALRSLPPRRLAYGLAHLAEELGCSERSAREISKQFRELFINTPGGLVIRAEDLDWLLLTHRGGRITTGAMSENDRERLKNTLRKRLEAA